MPPELWSWTLTAISAFTAWLIGSHHRWCWAMGLLGQVMWVAYALATDQSGFLGATAIYTTIYLRNWRRAIRMRAQNQDDSSGRRRAGADACGQPDANALNERTAALPAHGNLVDAVEDASRLLDRSRVVGDVRMSQRNPDTADHVHIGRERIGTRQIEQGERTAYDPRVLPCIEWNHGNVEVIEFGERQQPVELLDLSGKPGWATPQHRFVKQKSQDASGRLIDDALTVDADALAEAPAETLERQLGHRQLVGASLQQAGNAGGLVLADSHGAEFMVQHPVYGVTQVCGVRVPPSVSPRFTCKRQDSLCGPRRQLVVGHQILHVGQVDAVKAAFHPDDLAARPVHDGGELVLCELVLFAVPPEQGQNPPLGGERRADRRGNGEVDHLARLPMPVPGPGRRRAIAG